MVVLGEERGEGGCGRSEVGDGVSECSSVDFEVSRKKEKKKKGRTKARWKTQGHGLARSTSSLFRCTSTTTTFFFLSPAPPSTSTSSSLNTPNTNPSPLSRRINPDATNARTEALISASSASEYTKSGDQHDEASAVGAPRGRIMIRSGTAVASASLLLAAVVVRTTSSKSATVGVRPPCG